MIKHIEKVENGFTRMDSNDKGKNILTAFLGEDYYIYNQREDDTSIHLSIKTSKTSCACPRCGMENEHIHTTYERTLQDTPIHCKQTFLHVKAYKYDCLNTECICKVFIKPLTFAKRHQVRTNTMTFLILCVVRFMGNETASHVLKLLGVFASNDTIQRIYDSLYFKYEPDVEEIGIDDVSIRKGQTYATTIYDLKDHHLIELLEGRDGETLKAWLKNHPKVRLVARDRACAYATAIDELLPDCVQVADRFHLLQNLIDYLKDISKYEIPTEIFLKDGNVLDKIPR